MKFKDILEEYESSIAYAKRMKDPEVSKYYNRDESFWNGYVYASFQNFQKMKDLCDDSVSIMRTPTDSEVKKYTTSADFPLCGVIDYRGYQIPVYDDDYGQQMFAVIDGRDISGGAYNCNPEIDFEYEFDKYLLKLEGFEI